MECFEKIISSRYVNIKKIVEDKFYFYTNYNSPKSKDFDSHNQIAGLFYWGTINVQIRISAEIFKSSAKDSDDHFKSRSIEKNALATSSNQSETINSYEQVNKNYLNILNKMKSEPKYKRPLTWGGYYFRPNKFEIWIGNKNRINYREQFLLTDYEWKQEILQP